MKPKCENHILLFNVVVSSYFLAIHKWHFYTSIFLAYGTQTMSDGLSATPPCFEVLPIFFLQVKKANKHVSKMFAHVLVAKSGGKKANQLP